MKNTFRSFLLAASLFAVGCSKDNSGSYTNTANTSTQGVSNGVATITSGTGGTNYVGGTGVGGSLARFTIARNHLYAVDDAQLYTYSLANPQSPVRTSATNVGMNVETIYPYKDKLFIGSQQAMFIYSIANPSQPVMQGQASHVRACDPVVANDNIAYVTVRTGSNCGGATNALLVYNIANVMNPVQVGSFTLDNPMGLGLGANNRLYVCDGAAGLRIFNLSNPQQPQLIKTVSGYTFNDVIVLDDMLVCFTSDGTALFSLNGDDVQFAAKIAD